MIKHQNTIDEIRRREKRIAGRDRSIARTVREKARRIRDNEYEKQIMATAAKALKDDKQKRKPEDKKPGHRIKIGIMA